MKKLFLSAVLSAAVLIASPVFAVEMAGVSLAEKIVVADSHLQLNGAGIRKKMIFEVYLASLYVGSKTTDAAQILTATSPRRMQLNMLRTVDATSLYEALLEGLQRNVPAAQLKALGL